MSQVPVTTVAAPAPARGTGKAQAAATSSGAGVRRAPVYLALGLLAVFALGPLVILVLNSLRTNTEQAGGLLGLPEELSFQNFSQAWEQGSLGQTMTNSAILAVGTIVGVCVIAGLAAYALARLDVPGGKGVMAYLLFATAIPAQLFLVPLFFLWTRLGLYDTLLGLIIILIAINTPVAVLLLRSYLVSLPRDFEDAARIDGASEWRVMWTVVLPLSWPGLLTVALVTGLAAYNEFFFAVTFLSSEENQPVITSFVNFTENFTSNRALTSAAGLIIILPVLVLFLALQRRFIAGLTGSGLKG